VSDFSFKVLWLLKLPLADALTQKHLFLENTHRDGVWQHQKHKVPGVLPLCPQESLMVCWQVCSGTEKKREGETPWSPI